MGRPAPNPIEVRDATLLAPSLAEAVRRLEVRLGGVANSIIHGDRLSGFPGRGLEAVGVREYRHGDEVRGIDWRVTARKGRLHVREFDEERDLPFLILFHRSPTLLAGRSGIKEVRAMEVAGVLSALALKGGNRIGLLQGGAGPRRFLEPGRGRRQLLHLLAALLSPPVDVSEAPLPELLESVGRGVKERHRIFLVSDFRLRSGPRRRVREGLLSLRARHSLTPIRILDQGEGALPKGSSLYLRDPETGALAEPRGWGAEDSLRVGLKRDEEQVAEMFRNVGLREWSFDVGEGLIPRLRMLLAGDRWKGWGHG